MQKIVVLTYGDYKRASTWSNVPYLFIKSLKKNKNLIVKCYDIETKQNVFTYFYTFLCILIKRKSLYFFVRSKINYFIVLKKLKRILKQEDSNTDLYIVLSYDFDIKKYTNKKVMFISDWNVEYVLEKWEKRNPYLIEKNNIERTKKSIIHADFVVSLVEDFKKYAERKYNREILYFGMPLNVFIPPDGFDSIEERKYITFIGKKSYIESAQQIINTFNNYNINKYELHIIGMNKKDFKGINSNNIFFHGYLDKGNSEQLKSYYNIIKKSYVVINTKENWSGMSSIGEVLYYYRPIIISPNDEAKRKFKNCSFVTFSKNDSNSLFKAINKIDNYSIEKYKKICQEAHNFVEKYSYENFCNKLLKELEKGDK